MIPQSTSGLLRRHWLPRRPAIDIGRLRAWRNMCRASARPLSTQSYPSHRLHSGAADPCGPGGASWAARKLHIPSSPRWRFDLSCRPMLPSGSPINNTPMNGAVRHLSLCLSLRAAFVGRPALARSSRWPLTSDAQGRHRQQPSRWKRIPSPSIVRSKPLVPFPNPFTSSRACRFSSATPATAPIPQRASPRDPSPLPGRISRGEFFLPSRPPAPGRSSNTLGGAGNTGSLSRGSPPPPAPPPPPKHHHPRLLLFGDHRAEECPGRGTTLVASPARSRRVSTRGSGLLLRQRTGAGRARGMAKGGRAMAGAARAQARRTAWRRKWM